jgi:hypothetical protein
MVFQVIKYNKRGGQKYIDLHNYIDLRAHLIH